MMNLKIAKRGEKLPLCAVSGRAVNPLDIFVRYQLGGGYYCIVSFIAGCALPDEVRAELMKAIPKQRKAVINE